MVISCIRLLSKGQEGIHVFQDMFGLPFTLVVRGKIQENGKSYAIFRTMWEGDAGSHPEDERTGLPYCISFLTITFRSTYLQNSWNNTLLSWILSMVRSIKNGQ
jgi:hypothetical protein